MLDLIRSLHIPAAMLALVISVTLAACNGNSKQTDHKEESVTKVILEGTTWSSDFYFYHNNYTFETGSTGYSEDGQFAWSCPVDTIALGIPGNTILFGSPAAFKYSLIDTVLTIKYLSVDHDSATNTRRFYLRQSDTSWISDHEYAYGKEALFLEKNLK